MKFHDKDKTKIIKSQSSERKALANLITNKIRSISQGHNISQSVLNLTNLS